MLSRYPTLVTFNHQEDLCHLHVDGKGSGCNYYGRTRGAKGFPSPPKLPIQSDVEREEEVGLQVSTNRRDWNLVGGRGRVGFLQD